MTFDKVIPTSTYIFADNEIRGGGEGRGRGEGGGEKGRGEGKSEGICPDFTSCGGGGGLHGDKIGTDLGF
jgi:hypothetical protein